LARALPSLVAQRYPRCELILVDNASTDGTDEWVKAHFPDIQWLRNEQNVGFAAGVNQGFAAARGEVLVELNPDTTVEADWLFPLVEAVQQPNVGLATPRIMLMSEPDRINACGNEMSLTGLTFCIGVGERGERFMQHPIQPVPAVSGAAFAMSRKCYETIGGFDPDYFTYFEDTDLSWRARLAGFEVVLAAKSVVYHDYQFRFSPQKMFWIERNRHLTLLKCLHWGTLLRLLPALLLGEAIAWGYALLHGPATIAAKARAISWLVRHLDDVYCRRAAVQALRQVEDNVLVEAMTTSIRFDQTVDGPLGDWMNRLVEPLLGWWQQRLVVPS
jgi:GT2 family glycosyltransferase